MKTNKPLQTKPFTQFTVPPQAFDAFNKEMPVQVALGSARGADKREASDIRSVNWVPNVSGWRLTPQGLEIGASSGVFPPGTITFVDIQNIATDKILGRDTAGNGVIEQLGLGTGLVITGANLTLSFTKAELDGLVSDGNILYVGDITQYTDELAQDAIGNVVGSGLDYDDGTGAISVETATIPRITSGSGAPGTTPPFVGYIYVDTTGAKAYISTGTSSSADWSILN